MKALRLRPGLHYAPVDGGVYFSSARATFVMRGPAALFGVVDRCVPLLEDGTDIDDLVTALGAETARRLVTHLVSTFDQRGLILHVDRLQGPEPSPDERERFPETLAYLETHRPDPYTDFRTVRAARVLLAGPATALGPACRSLLRAGVGAIAAATDEPDRLRALASRHPEVSLIDNPAGRRFDAVVFFSEEELPEAASAPVTIPVRLGKDLAIVGPALRDGRDRARAERIWARARAWWLGDGEGLLVRPSGDLLAGALAGQVALDALIGFDPDRIHLVHGPNLTSDSIRPGWDPAGGVEFDPPTEWGRQGDEAVAGAGWLDSVSAPWTGLFRVWVPDDLAQMPLALTVAEGRSEGFDGCTVGFGPDQEAAAVEAGLGALRHHGQGAAGLDETRWLLDGLLRRLAAEATEAHQVEWLDVDDLEARRLWRALEEHELTPVRLVRRQVPGFGWTLISVHDRDRQTLLAAGWGPDPAVAARVALSAAMARQQVGPVRDPAGAGAGYVNHLHDAHRLGLEAEVKAWLDATGRRLRGRRRRRDPVAGPIPVPSGAVWLDG